MKREDAEDSEAYTSEEKKRKCVSVYNPIEEKLKMKTHLW